MQSKQSCRPFTRPEAFVEHIFLMKENYFIEHPNASNEAKDRYMAEKIEEALRMIEDRLAMAGEILHLQFLKAKLLNIPPSFNAEAEKIMRKYVKFHTNDEKAWNLLGEILFKKKDYDSARNCFAESQNHVKNIEGLINWSLLLRDLPYKTVEERVENINFSIQKAKEAVEMDTNKGMSWYILGNAHLEMYSISSQSKDHLQLALKAYHLAEKDVQCQHMPEFYCNKGMACSYARDFLVALNSFDKARQLDPVRKSSSDQYIVLLTFLDDIMRFTYNKGQLPDRRVKELRTSINIDLLGPYSERTSLSSGSGVKDLQYMMLKSLEVGLNDDKVIVGKVISYISDPKPFSSTFCMIDEEGTCINVTVFNMSPEKAIIIGNAVTIASPNVERFDFEHREKRYTFQWINVEDPLLLVVDGKYMDPSFKAK